MIVDAHMHIEHENPNLIYAEEREAGVDRAIIFSIWNPSRESNDLTLNAYKMYPKFFIPWGHVRPSDSYWRDELDRIVKLGWKGLKLHFGEFGLPSADRTISDLLASHIGDYLVESLNAIMEVAQEHNLVTLIDCMGRLDVMTKLVMIFTKAPIIIAHLGSNYDLTKNFCELAKMGHVYLDCSNRHLYRIIKEAVKMAGADKIIWGSDGWWQHPAAEIMMVKVLKLPKEEEEKVLGGNIMRLLE